MFIGIVTATGEVTATGGSGDARRLAVATGGLSTTAWKPGDSIAVSGVCLTLVTIGAGRFEADLSHETLARTTLGKLSPGSGVNLEPAVAAGAALGGHLVSGHVDGIATVGACREVGGALHASIAAPEVLARFIAEKGSVTLDGVSLTIGRVTGATFEIVLVPHTRAVTTLGSLASGRTLNLEVDLIARYLDRLLEARGVR